MSWSASVRRIATAVARDYPDTETEDLEQSLWEGILLAQQSGEMTDPTDVKADQNLYYIARLAAWNERKQHLTISSQYGYRTSDVRALLKTFFDRENWYDATTPEDAYSELGSVALEMSADLSRAYDKLETNQKVLIFQSFALNEKVDSKKLSRVISRMADIINTYQPGKRVEHPGGRRLVSSTLAKHITSVDYSGEDK